MKDRLLYLTIGLLIGIIVIQWTMPSGQASITSDPVGPVIAASGEAVMTSNGQVWVHRTSGWLQIGTLPIPISEIQFFSNEGTVYYLIDKNGDQWKGGWDHWVNRGHPPVNPVPAVPSTMGKLKNEYNGD